jgi:outer membrane protein OmpA-like peptidoglycan-associated protein
METRRWTRRLALLLVAGLGLLGAAGAQDLAGARDYPGLKRFAGSAIVGHEVRNFDAVDFQTSTYEGYDPKTRTRLYEQPPLHLEGKLTRTWYEAPGEVRALEVYRNYVDELAASGYETLYDSAADAQAGQWTNFLATFSDTGGRDFIKNNRSPMVFVAAAQNTVRTGTFRKGNVTLRLVVVDWPKADKVYKAAQGAYVALDVLETRAMEQRMEVVSASEIEKSLTANGKVAIYGIHFDFGKADVKPESRPSLEQIAAFLKDAPEAKLHVVGHTDSVGGFDANLALSRRRAEAVAAVLVKDYGIAASRLTGNGVASLAPVASNATDEGRAKNRRVELVLQ